MKCPYCGTDNPAGETFCSNCGGYLQGDDAATVAPVIEARAAGGEQGVDTVSGTSSDSGRTVHMLVPRTELQNGRYVIEKMLGEGGMGTAALARDTRVSNKRVVIKELLTDEADPSKQQEDVRNFEREVETVAHLDHPLIPTVTDSFQEGSRYFMVQEYAAGENLENHLERIKRPMPEKEVLTYASQVLDILEYLEKQNPPIVHRDIKPANIIIGSNDNRAHLVDFGIAREAVTKEAKRKQTSALGTPGYAPPEQYQGNADTRSDLYALAATLHHLLTNRDPRDYPPFTYPAVRTLNPQVSAATERVLEKALQLDINKRYQTASAMKRDIDEILADRVGESGEIREYARGLRPVEPRPAPSSAGRTARPPAYVPPSRLSGPLPPLGGGQQQQQMFAPPRMQQPTPMYRPPMGQQAQGSNSYLLMSFALLMVVLIIIGLILFFISGPIG